MYNHMQFLTFSFAGVHSVKVKLEKNVNAVTSKRKIISTVNVPRTKCKLPLGAC